MYRLSILCTGPPCTPAPKQQLKGGLTLRPATHPPCAHPRHCCKSSPSSPYEAADSEEATPSPEDVQTALKGLLWQCEDSNSIFDVLSAEAHNLNASCTAVALARLSQFHGGVGTRELTSNPGFQRVVELLEKQAEYLSDKDLSRSMGALAKLNYRPNRLVRPMLAQAERIALDMSSFALATTIAALGRLKLQSPGLMDALLANAEALAPTFDAKELNMVILGLSGMGDYNPPRDFLAAAGQQFEALLPEFGIQFGALTFHNFAKLEHYSPPLCQAMDDLLAEGSPEWTPKLISFTLWAFAKLRHMPGPAARALVEDWLASMEAGFQDAPGNVWASIMWAAATLGWQLPDQVWDAVEAAPGLQTNVGWSMEQAVQLLWAMAIAGESHRPLFRRVLERITSPEASPRKLSTGEMRQVYQASVLSQQAGQALPDTVPEGLLRAGRKSLNAFSAGAPPSLSHRRIVARLRQLGLNPDVMVGGDGGLPGLDIVFERPGQRPLGLQVQGPFDLLQNSGDLVGRARSDKRVLEAQGYDVVYLALDRFPAGSYSLEAQLCHLHELLGSHGITPPVSPSQALQSVPDPHRLAPRERSGDPRERSGDPRDRSVDPRERSGGGSSAEQQRLQVGSDGNGKSSYRPDAGAGSMASGEPFPNLNPQKGAVPAQAAGAQTQQAGFGLARGDEQPAPLPVAGQPAEGSYDWQAPHSAWQGQQHPRSGLCWGSRYGSLDLGSQVAADVARREGQPAEASPAQPRAARPGKRSLGESAPQGALSGTRRAEQQESLGDDASQWAELQSALDGSQPGATEPQGTSRSEPQPSTSDESLPPPLQEGLGYQLASDMPAAKVKVPQQARQDGSWDSFQDLRSAAQPDARPGGGSEAASTPEGLGYELAAGLSDREITDPGKDKPQSSWEAFMARRAKMQGIETGPTNPPQPVPSSPESTSSTAGARAPTGPRPESVPPAAAESAVGGTGLAAESAGGQGGQQAWDELQDALKLLEQEVGDDSDDEGDLEEDDEDLDGDLASELEAFDMSSLFEADGAAAAPRSSQGRGPPRRPTPAAADEFAAMPPSPSLPNPGQAQRSSPQRSSRRDAWGQVNEGAPSQDYVIPSMGHSQSGMQRRDPAPFPNPQPATPGAAKRAGQATSSSSSNRPSAPPAERSSISRVFRGAKDTETLFSDLDSFSSRRKAGSGPPSQAAKPSSSQPAQPAGSRFEPPTTPPPPPAPSQAPPQGPGTPQTQGRRRRGVPRPSKPSASPGLGDDGVASGSDGGSVGVNLDPKARDPEQRPQKSLAASREDPWAALGKPEEPSGTWTEW